MFIYAKVDHSGHCENLSGSVLSIYSGVDFQQQSVVCFAAVKGKVSSDSLSESSELSLVALLALQLQCISQISPGCNFVLQ